MVILSASTVVVRRGRTGGCRWRISMLLIDLGSSASTLAARVTVSVIDRTSSNMLCYPRTTGLRMDSEGTCWRLLLFTS